MKRINALAVALATVLMATAAYAGTRDEEQQAPRSQEQQAPRGQDNQAPRGDLQVPRG